MDNSYAITVIVIVSVAVVALVAIIGGLLHARRVRLLAHAERMKALELGREMPDDEETAKIKAQAVARRHAGPKAPVDKCYAIAGQTCFWGFVFAAGVRLTDGPHGLGVAIAIASAAGAVGVTSVICGTALAARAAASRPSGYGSAPVKEYYEPEEV